MRWVLLLLSWLVTFVGAELPTASRVLSASGIQGGFCLVIGTTDGEFEAGLTAPKNVVVQGLALNEQAAVAARSTILAKRLYPLASVLYESSAQKLPYMDGMVNVLVADLDALGDKGPSDSEIDRVLGYTGVAYIKQGGSWKTRVKPVPADVYEYTHWKGDSTLSSYQDDRHMRIPNQLRWIGAPAPTVRSSQGSRDRINEAERVSGGAWMGYWSGGIFSRDAFSGVMLWYDDMVGKRWPFGGGQPGGEMWVANGRGLFTYDPVPGSGMVAYNIRTGAIEKRYTNTVTFRPNPEPKNANKLVTWDAHLLSVAQNLVYRDNIVQIYGNKVYFVDEESGEAEWTWSAGDDSTIIVRNGLIQDSVLVLGICRYDLNNPDTKGQAFPNGSTRGFWATFKQVTGIRLRDGEHLWTTDSLPGTRAEYHELIAGGNGRCMAVFIDGPHHCINVHTGKIEWSVERRETIGYGSYRGNAIAVPDKRLVVFSNHGGYTSHDVATGATVGKMSLSGTYRGSCPGSTIAPHYFVHSGMFVPSKQLTEFVEKSNREFYMTGIGSATCSWYPIFSYGASYMMGGKCTCWRPLPAQSCSYAVEPSTPINDDMRLVTGNSLGPISGDIAPQTAAQSSQAGKEWTKRCLGEYLPRWEKDCAWKEPHNRFETMQSGVRFAYWRPSPAWTSYAQQETAPVQAGDLTLSAIVHEHRLVAKRNGAVVWNFVAGSRISHYPEVDGSRAYFGSHDGYVYAVNLSDGSLAWKFQAAPAQLRMMAWSQVESCWPVFGVVLHEGKLYATAGRLPYFDGGIHAYCLNPADGSIEWHVKNVSGFISSASLTKVPVGTSGEIKVCDPIGHKSMVTIAGHNVSYALNDVPQVIDNELQVIDWYIKLDNPYDTIWFPDNFQQPPVTVARESIGSPSRKVTHVSPRILLVNGVLKVTGLGERVYKVGLNDALGRSLYAFMAKGRKQFDLGLKHLPDGFYIAWVEMDQRRYSIKANLISSR